MFHSNVISIIAGGSSFKHVQRKKIPGLIIGVNDSFVHTECDICVSMDRLWTENRWAAIMHEEKPTYIRSAAIKNIEDRPPFVSLFDCDTECLELSDRWDKIDGNNSAFCALSLAYLARPMAIYLFGFDMVGDYWYPRYSWAGNKVKRGPFGWAKQFNRAKEQLDWQGIDVINVSHVSQIPCFRKVSPATFNESPRVA